MSFSRSVCKFRVRIDSSDVGQRSDFEIKALIPAYLRGGALERYSNEINKNKEKRLARMYSCKEYLDSGIADKSQVWRSLSIT